MPDVVSSGRANAQTVTTSALSVWLGIFQPLAKRGFQNCRGIARVGPKKRFTDFAIIKAVSLHDGRRL